MLACFQHALDKGFSIAVTPHLDDGSGQKGWRNGARVLDIGLTHVIHCELRSSGVREFHIQLPTYSPA